MKWVLITGASSGLGQELAYIFDSKNYNTILIARNKEKIEKVANKLKNECIIFISNLTEVNSSEDIYNFILEKNIKIDILINNAGIGHYNDFIDTDLKIIEDMININIISLTKLTKLFIPMLKENKENSYIIQIGSIAGFQAGPGNALYYATKAFVLLFSEAIEKELRNTNVKLKIIAPGAFKSSFQVNSGSKGNIDKLKITSSKEVADYVFKSLSQNGSLFIFKLKSKIAVLGAKLLPRSILINIVHLIQKDKKKKYNS